MRFCGYHNSYFAERDYGKDVMDRYRRSGNRVSEPVVRYETGPRMVRVSSYDT